MPRAETVYTQAEMEMQVSIARVETLVSMGREDFLDHKTEDDKNFSSLHKANRAIIKHIDEAPARMMECRTTLETDLTAKMNRRFVDKNEFMMYTSKFKWVVAGATILATILAWIAHFALDIIKVTGG